MENRYLSLLYPSEEKATLYAAAAIRPHISDTVCDELGLTELFSLKNSMLSEYFTSDAEVIRYRQSVIADMLETPEIGETLNRVLPILFDILEIRSLDTQNNSTGESYLYSITEIELYTSVLAIMKETLLPLKDSLTGRAFKRLCEVVETLTESEYYKNINKQLEELTSRVREVKSVTIGVNLDSRLKAESAGVLSVNNDKFKSGQLIDKILRLDFKSDEMTCIAPLTPFRNDQSENQQLALTYALSS
ncbi:MAG: hypothetical protein IKC63_01415, partial [Clostridia bacterium]|nr:hypothetical protein [Clostridia bacterium]